MFKLFERRECLFYILSVAVLLRLCIGLHSYSGRAMMSAAVMVCVKWSKKTKETALQAQAHHRAMATMRHSDTGWRLL